MFLKGFNEKARERLAQIVGICLSNSLGSSACLVTLFEEHLVKDGKSPSKSQNLIEFYELY